MSATACDGLTVLVERMIMKALSPDLRIRAVERYLEENETQLEIAKIFKISVSSFKRFLTRYRRKESLIPKPHTGGNEPLIDKRGLKILEKISIEFNDLTLKEYSEKLKFISGINVSIFTICRALKKLQITRKKRPSMHRNKKGQMYRKNEKNLSSN
jgi:putative transposase